MYSIKSVFLILTSCYLLTACGQMGPLYLPPKEPVKASVPDSKTTQTDTTTQSTQDKPNAE